jgi:6-phosphogluconate dehydrogenase
MQLGMIGLGRMGANMVRRLVRNGHACVVYDRNPGAVAELAAEGARGSRSLAEFVQKLTRPGSLVDGARRPSSTRASTTCCRCSTRTTS